MKTRRLRVETDVIQINRKKLKSTSAMTVTTNITMLSKDVIGYLMFKYLTPFDIMNCYMAHKCFHSLTEYKLSLVKKARTFTLYECISRYDDDLFDYIFKMNGLKHLNSICIGLSLMISSSIQSRNIHTFTMLLKNFQHDMTASMLGQSILEVCVSYISSPPENFPLEKYNRYATHVNRIYELMLSTLFDIMDYRNIDIKMLNTKDNLNMLINIYYICLKCNAVELLTVLDRMRGIRIPKDILRFDMSDEMREYIQQNGI